jgi:hypothetical protein
VIVDHETVEVVPAEQLTLAGDAILFAGEPLDDNPHEDAWTARLKRAIQAAGSSAEARAADPFRRAADEPKAVQARPRRSWTGALVPAGLGAVAGVALELAVGLRGVAPAREQRGRWDRIGARGQVAAARLPAALGQAHRAALAAATSGGLAEVRAFLADFGGGPERASMLARYESLLPDGLRAATRAADVAPMIDDVKRFRASRALADQVRARWLELVEREFALGDPPALRAIVKRSRRAGDDALVSRAEDALARACDARIPLARDPDHLGNDPGFVEARLLRRLCRDQDPQLTWQPADDNPGGIDGRAADLLASDLTAYSKRLGQPMEIVAAPRNPVLVSVRVKDTKGESERACIALYRFVDDDGESSGPELSTIGTCTTSVDYGWMPRR